MDKNIKKAYILEGVRSVYSSVFSRVIENKFEFNAYKVGFGDNNLRVGVDKAIRKCYDVDKINLPYATIAIEILDCTFPKNVKDLSKDVKVSYRIVDTCRSKVLGSGCCTSNCFYESTAFSCENIGKFLKGSETPDTLAKKAALAQGDVLRGFFQYVDDTTVQYMTQIIAGYIIDLIHKVGYDSNTSRSNNTGEKSVEASKETTEQLKTLKDIMQLAASGHIRGNLNLEFKISGNLELSIDSSIDGKIKL